MPPCASERERVATAAFPRVLQWGAHPDLVGAEPVSLEDDELLLYRPADSDDRTPTTRTHPAPSCSLPARLPALSEA
eukprot:7186429-Prymnesium_polylepis.1